MTQNQVRTRSDELTRLTSISGRLSMATGRLNRQLAAIVLCCRLQRKPIGTVKSHRKSVRRRCGRKINGHKDSIFGWSYLYLVGLFWLASSHSPIAVIVAENSAARIRTVTLRMNPPHAFSNVSILLLQIRNKRKKRIINQN